MSLIKFLSNLFRPKPESLNPAKSFEEIYEDLGLFEYTAEGFTLTDKSFSKTVRWQDIDQINAYKKDLFGYDLIVMEIVQGEKALAINEESPGWFQFVIRTKEVFPAIGKDWEIEIAQPPFAENFTTLYSKAE